MSPSDWTAFNQAAPAWAQAIGSVLAVYFAGRTVVLASRSARLDRLHGADAVFKLAASAIADARQSFVSNRGAPANPAGFDRQRFVYADRLLKELESKLIEIGSEQLPLLTGDAQATLRDAGNTFEAAVLTLQPSEEGSKLLTKLDTHRAAMETNRNHVLSFVARQRRITKWWWVPFIADI